jgi:hypothetical protein
MNVPRVTPIERPRCKRCYARMTLVEIELLKDDAEKRIFECSKCNVVVDKIASDPLKSEAMARLTVGIKSPT